MLLGFDIGGTKCGVVTGDGKGILRAEKIPTGRGRRPEEILAELSSLADRLLDGERPEAIGVSCGGPLDSVRGVILSPPNLPGWDEVPVTAISSVFASGWPYPAG